ncbi:hypothetical protein MKW92_021067 [Papaver armeniacum]|nr:hypothetical protein MKW92_021067 [Papaver armeniacum]
MDIIKLEDQEQEMQYQAHVWNMIYGSVDSSVLKCTVELGLFDAIHNSSKPMTLSSLSSASPSLSQLKTENLYRLLRYLSHMNLIAIEGNEIFSLTDMSKLLLDNQERSLKPFATCIADPFATKVWHEYRDYCLSPDDAPIPFVKVHGKPMYEVIADIPEINQIFNDCMACDTRLSIPAFLQGCHSILNGVNKIIDIGGGTGASMSCVLKAFPEIKCMVLDLPHVVAAAPEVAGVEMVAGDMFEFIPPADALLLKFILHNWKDAECIKLLKKCKESIIRTSNGKVIIIDVVLEQDKAADGGDHYLIQAGLSLDLDMMMCAGGRERTKDEWIILLEEAGFNKIEFTTIFAIPSVIVAYPSIE